MPPAEPTKGAKPRNRPTPVPPEAEKPRPPSTVITLIAGLVPTLAYLATSSGHAHWFDTGEFVAAVADFGVTHPPGHPLAVIVLGTAQLLPFGSLAFRVAVICALLGGASIAVLFRAFHHTLSAIPVIQGPHVAALAVGAAWWTAGTAAWWTQAVRPEVYTLQALLLCVIFERLCWLFATDYDDIRPFYQASFALGLALSNHHYLAALTVPAGAWLLVRIARERGWRPFAWGTGFIAVGLLPYLFLPIRSMQEPYVNLGEPTSPARFWWVVSAQAFQKSIEMEGSGTFGERFADVMLVLAEDLHLVVLVFAALGIYLMLRLRTSRRLAAFWLSVAALYAVGRALIGFVSGNPDAIAYFMPTFAAVALFAAFAVGVILAAVVDTKPDFAKFTRNAAVVVALLSLLQFPRSAHSAALDHFTDTDTFDDGLRRALPPRAVVLAHNPQTLFRYWGGEAEEWTRPDVTFIALPFVTYPGFVEALIADHPELKPLLRSYLVQGELGAGELQELTASRPVLVEMDVRVPRALHPDLLPSELYYRVHPGGATDAEERAAAKDHRDGWASLYQRLGPAPSTSATDLNAHTHAQLLWRHYNDAMYFLTWNDRKSAARVVEQGLQINGSAREFRAMKAALDETPSDQPLDLSAFEIVVQ